MFLIIPLIYKFIIIDNTYYIVIIIKMRVYGKISINTKIQY